jgi:cell division protein FtsB
MKVFIAFLLVLLCALQYRLWVADDGFGSLWSLRSAVAAQRNENADLARRNAELAGEVKDLKEGTAAIEEHARYDLGMIGPSETFYQILDPVTDASLPTQDSGSSPVQRTAQ